MEELSSIVILSKQKIPQGGIIMDKLGTFIAGVVVGAVGLGVTACLVEGSSVNSSCSDSSDENNGIEGNGKTENSLLLSSDASDAKEKQTPQPQNNTAETIEKVAEALLKIMEKNNSPIIIN